MRSSLRMSQQQRQPPKLILGKGSPGRTKVRPGETLKAGFFRSSLVELKGRGYQRAVRPGNGPEGAKGGRAEAKTPKKANYEVIGLKQASKRRNENRHRSLKNAPFSLI